MQNMSVGEILLFAVAAYVAVMSLARLMLGYRRQLEEVLTEQLRAQRSSQQAAAATRQTPNRS